MTRVLKEVKTGAAIGDYFFFIFIDLDSVTFRVIFLQSS